MEIRKMRSDVRFTVVTPNYNMGKFLKQTIDSVLQNIEADDEYFVIDGGSSDSSKETILAYEDRLSGWVSEPDLGYSDAVAKGFRKASGRYLCWVNSGDLLLEGALTKAQELLEQDQADLIFGDDVLIDENDLVLRVSNGYAQDLRAMMLFAGWTPLQESCFWTSDLYRRVGGINPRLKYAADYDLFLRMSLKGRCQYNPVIFGAFRRHDGQLSVDQWTKYKAERKKCQVRELELLPPSPWLPLSRAYYWTKMHWRIRTQAGRKDTSKLVGESVDKIKSRDSSKA